MFPAISKMSPFSQILCRGFSSSSTSTPFNHLYKAKDIKLIVESFKKNTQNVLFRRKETYDDHTVLSLIRAKAFGSIEEILEDQKKYVEISNEGFSVRLITLYGRSHLFDRAHQLFDEMPELKCVRTVKSFNALLGACVSCKEFEKVGGFFRELPEKLGIKPDIVSYNTVIKAFCEMGSLDEAASMVDVMDMEGVSPDLITFNILLDGFYKKGRFSDGDEIWEMMGKSNVVPDIISYNMRLFGFVLQDKMKEACGVFGEIMNKGLKPDVFTFNFLFKGFCTDVKYMEEAKRWFNIMMETKCEPNVATFDILLPFACDSGDFQFAARMCRKVFYCRLRVKGVVQRVIDGLVKQSNVNEAELLVRVGKYSKMSAYHKLKMPKSGK